MNWDTIEGNWKQLKGKLKEKWGKLTDDHLDTIDGKREQLSGKIQEAYGVSKDEADKQIDDFAERNKDHKAPSTSTFLNERPTCPPISAGFLLFGSSMALR